MAGDVHDTQAKLTSAENRGARTRAMLSRRSPTRAGDEGEGRGDLKTERRGTLSKVSGARNRTEEVFAKVSGARNRARFAVFGGFFDQVGGAKRDSDASRGGNAGQPLGGAGASGEAGSAGLLAGDSPLLVFLRVASTFFIRRSYGRRRNFAIASLCGSSGSA